MAVQLVWRKCLGEWMNINKEKFVLVGILAITLILAVYIIINSITGNKSNKIQNSFQALTSNENNVDFQVTPLSASEFEISMSTHSVELDFGLTEISILYDGSGNIYKPLKWEGSAPGGHHRSGTLKFPEIDKNAKSIKLVINDGIEREFNWNLK